VNENLNQEQEEDAGANVDTDFSEGELMNAMESQNLMISILQKELEAKSRICKKY
jgi:hypothetical protein